MTPIPCSSARFAARRLAPLALLACACSSKATNTTTAIHDTSGATFDVICDSDGACTASATGATPAAPACGTGTPGYGITWARFVTVCAVVQHGGSSGSSGPLCRIVACANDGECPTIDGTRYACVNALCQSNGGANDDGGRAVAPIDAILLCVGASPRPTGCAPTDASYDAARSKVEAACPNALSTSPYTATCATPQMCAQP